MRKRFFGLIAVSLSGAIFTSCNNKSSNNTGVDNTVGQIDSTFVKSLPKVSFYNPIENYFTTIRPNKKVETIVVDSIQFEKDFQYAATMNTTPTKIDFSRENVGAIILPETSYNTEIKIQAANVVNDTLHIIYYIKEGTDKQTYTTVPVQLFAFNKKFNLVFDYKK